MSIRIKFVCNHTVKAEGGASYKEGQVVSFPDTAMGQASANHFLKRQLAVEVEQEAKAAQPKAEAAPSPPPTRETSKDYGGKRDERKDEKK